LNLQTLALAYDTAGSGVHTNAQLAASMTSALDWMYTNIYNEHHTNQYENWWHWQIGVPLALNNITVLLYNNLTGVEITNYMNAVNYFTPTPTGDEANLLWTATVVGVRGAIIMDPTKLNAAVLALSRIFPYVTGGDGYYADGSFVFHTYYAYTDSYGESLIQYFSRLMEMVNGSRWALTDPNQTNVYQWVYNCYQPVIHDCEALDTVRGRAIARYDETSQFIGGEVVAAILHVAQFAPTNDALAFRSMAKCWLLGDTVTNFVASTDLGTVPLAQAVLADPAIPIRPEMTAHYTYAGMDRVVHLRPSYTFGLSMFSDRIATFEFGNDEDLEGWYTGYGMTYLYNTDQIQFDDCFWPTVNSYQLPDTTVDTQPRSAGSGGGYLSANDWTGGVTLGAWGAAGMQLNAWNSSLTARKSWFMFDNEIVCLGAGINSTSNCDVQTIVEDRKLTSVGTNDFTVNGTVEPEYLGWTGSLAGVTWAHLTGNLPGADIGYYFPQPATLNCTRATSTGSWYGIDPYEVGSPTNVIGRNYLSCWFDHGTNPVNGTYAYVLLPGQCSAKTAAYAAAPQVSVILNTNTMQAVSQGPLGITAANFWTDGSQTVGGITANRKSSVMVQLTETNIALAVADPTQTNTAGISVTLVQPVTQVSSLDSGVTVGELSPAVQITAATAGAKGKTFHASFLYSLTNFAAWQKVYFTPAQLANPAIGGPTADPEQDGISNLIKYALLLNPWQPATNTIQPSIIGGTFEFSYARRELAADLLYNVDVSTNLTAWDSNGTQFSQSVLSDNGTEQVVLVTENTASNFCVTRFFRLRVTYLNPL